MPSQVPLKNPYFSIAIRVYCEQDGVNLQAGGVSGEIEFW